MDFINFNNLNIMKRFIYLILSISLFYSITNAQTPQTPVKPDIIKKDTSWKHGLFTAFNFNQVSLTNWAAGGESSLSLSSLVSGFANYKKNNISWDNSIMMAYGILKGSDNPSKKNQDKIELNSKFGYKATDVLNYAALFSFNSQFAKGYNYPNPSDPYQKQYVSNFFAPAYFILSLGMDYKPTSYLSFYLSPATGRFIFVTDQVLADSGSYGVTHAITHLDTAKHIIIDKHGKTSKVEFGAFFVGKFQKDIMKNINLMSKISLFDDYTNPDPKKRANMVVNWEILLDMKINKYFSANIYTNLIYDDQINIPEYGKDKIKVVSSGPRTQFKEVLGIGFSHKF
jgi:hypothetical protein